MVTLPSDAIMRIVLPKESLDGDEGSEQFLELLNSCQVRKIGYFDEQIKGYVVTQNEKRVKDLELELVYSSKKFTSIRLDSPIYTDQTTSVWRFNAIITPEKLSNELIVKASYKQINEGDDKFLPNFKLTESLEIADLTLGKTVKHKKAVSASTSIRISPIFQMKFKTIKMEKVLTSLELNLSSFLKELDYHVEINSISIHIKNCEVVEYSQISYPLTLKKNSSLNLAYRLINNDIKWVKPIVVTINSIINSEAEITTKWITNIDFLSTPTTINPSSVALNAPSPNPGLNLSKMRSVSSSFISSKKALNKIRSNSSVTLNTAKKGLTISVSGQTNVKLGEVFKWKLQLINRSTENLSLILYIQSSITKHYEKSVPPIPLQNSNHIKNDPVPLYSTNQLVRAFYHEFSKVGLISLTNNLKINLEAGNLYETELELIGIEKGLVNLHDFKMLEIKSGEVFECGKLLDVLVV